MKRTPVSIHEEKERKREREREIERGTINNYSCYVNEVDAAYTPVSLSIKLILRCKLLRIGPVACIPARYKYQFGTGILKSRRARRHDVVPREQAAAYILFISRVTKNGARMSRGITARIRLTPSLYNGFIEHGRPAIVNRSSSSQWLIEKKGSNPGLIALIVDALTRERHHHHHRESNKGIVIASDPNVSHPPPSPE